MLHEIGIEENIGRRERFTARTAQGVGKEWGKGGATHARMIGSLLIVVVLATC